MVFFFCFFENNSFEIILCDFQFLIYLNEDWYQKLFCCYVYFLNKYCIINRQFVFLFDYCLLIVIEVDSFQKICFDIVKYVFLNMNVNNIFLNFF